MTNVPPTPERPPPPTPRSWLRWLPLVVLPLGGMIAAALLILTADDSDPAEPGAAAQRATPPPVTFVSPTPPPVTPTDSTPAAGSLLDQPAPAFALTTLDGATLDLPTLRGEIVFLNFWATWCPPCRTEMPALQTLHEQGAAAGVRVIAVTNPFDGQTEADVRDFAADFALTLPIAIEDDLDFYRAYGVLQLPTTFLIDRDGVVRYRHLGELTPALIDDYLAQLDVTLES